MTEIGRRNPAAHPPRKTKIEAAGTGGEQDECTIKSVVGNNPILFFGFALQKPVWIGINPTSQYFYLKFPSAGLGTLNRKSKGLARITFCKGLAPLHENVAFFP